MPYTSLSAVTTGHLPLLSQLLLIYLPRPQTYPETPHSRLLPGRTVLLPRGPLLGPPDPHPQGSRTLPQSPDPTEAWGRAACTKGHRPISTPTALPAPAPGLTPSTPTSRVQCTWDVGGEEARLSIGSQSPWKDSQCAPSEEMEKRPRPRQVEGWKGQRGIQLPLVSRGLRCCPTPEFVPLTGLVLQTGRFEFSQHLLGASWCQALCWGKTGALSKQARMVGASGI